MTRYYKASGRFAVYDKHKTLITDQLFVNKIFETAFPQAALNMAIGYAGRKARKKYGKGATVSQESNLKLTKSHAPVKRAKKSKSRNNKNKKAGLPVQGNLFPPEMDKLAG